MERPTERDSNGTNFLVCREGCNGGPACFECEQKAIDRLAAYEDFVERWKLTSIEDASRIFRRINALGGTDLMGQYRDLGPINHLRSLVQAEKDGRLVVLNKPRQPLVWGNDAHDSILCPNCSHDLMGGFPETDPCEMSMYQCPYCGQPIDDSTALTRAEAEAALKKREDAGNETD